MCHDARTRAIGGFQNETIGKDESSDEVEMGCAGRKKQIAGNLSDESTVVRIKAKIHSDRLTRLGWDD
jgi:hypothetical protein